MSKHHSNISIFLFFNFQSIVIILSIGFTLAFGGLFSKTFRVYRVFTASKSFTRVVSLQTINQNYHAFELFLWDIRYIKLFLGFQAIKDGELFGSIGLLMLIDIGIFVFWMVVSPFYMKIEQLDIIVSWIIETFKKR